MNAFENPEKKQLTIGDARQQIEAVRQQIMQMGANDSENETLNLIVEQLEDGDLSPEEAINRVNGLRDSKQAYH